MRNKRVEIKSILDFLNDRVIEIKGNLENQYIDNLAEVERVNETTLDWINPSKQNKQQIAESSKARVLLVDDSVEFISGKLLIVVKNPKVALAEIGNHFFVGKSIPGIHPTAIIDPEAVIGSNCHIGPYCVIGKAVIGNNCDIDSNVRIYDDVELGENCVVSSGVVLGDNGFGFEKDADGKRFRFPQIGKLIIGNSVEIGANTCIDRGSLADTVIGNNTKISKLCVIAHNNKIGENVEITGSVMLSGSNIIEDDVWLSPNVSVKGWVHIGEGAFVGMGAVVVKDIPAHETWVGNPAHKLEKK